MQFVRILINSNLHFLLYRSLIENNFLENLIELEINKDNEEIENSKNYLALIGATTEVEGR